MKIKTLFEALEKSTEKSGLGVICRELESQGYTVRVDDIDVSSDGFFNDRYLELEKKIDPFKISLYKGEVLDREILVEFVDFREIVVSTPCPKACM